MNTQPPGKKIYEIVVGFDFSQLGERAVEEALTIASQNAPAEVHVVTIAQQSGPMVRLPGEGEPISEDLARETVRLRIAQLAEEYQTRRGALAIERIAIYVIGGLPVGDPAKLIVELAGAVDANLIVVGTHGRSGVARLVLGSVAQQVVRDAGTNVYVVRPSDFLKGKKVPEVQPALVEGQPHLRHFEHRRVYHYVDKVSNWTARTMPVS